MRLKPKVHHTALDRAHEHDHPHEGPEISRRRFVVGTLAGLVGFAFSRFLPPLPAASRVLDSQPPAIVWAQSGNCDWECETGRCRTLTISYCSYSAYCIGPNPPGCGAPHRIVVAFHFREERTFRDEGPYCHCKLCDMETVSSVCWGCCGPITT